MKDVHFVLNQILSFTHVMWFTHGKLNAQPQAAQEMRLKKEAFPILESRDLSHRFDDVHLDLTGNERKLQT